MIKVDKLNPFGRMCISMGMIPSSYKESLTYEEQLMWFCNYLEKTVIPAVNNNADALIELQGLYNEIKTYVDEYFENLDVQEEINNKLDDMAESGELTEIIAQYLGLAGMITFDTVAEMKLAENLVDGSKCTTLGYHSTNDGGSATYKIREVTNEDVVDEMTLIALADISLVAELVIDKDYINPLQLGMYGDGVHNDSPYIQKAVNLGNVLMPRDFDIKIDNTITINGQRIIDLSRSTLSGNATPFFKINTHNATSQLTWITLKNGTIHTSGNGIEIYDSYFITLENLTIKLLSSDSYGVYVENGFNNRFINLQIYGINTEENNTGIYYGINGSSTIQGSSNITNILFDSCLIQSLNKGIMLYGESGGEFDTILLSNNGFSSIVDKCIDLNYPNISNIKIVNTRVEFSNLFTKTYNGSCTAINDLHLLNSNGIENSGFLYIDGTLINISNDNTKRYAIKSNSSYIKLACARIQNITNDFIDSSCYNTYISSSVKNPWLIGAGNIQPAFINFIYNGSVSTTLSTINACNGTELYLLRRDGDSGWLLPDGTYNAVGKLLHFIHDDSGWVKVE